MKDEKKELANLLFPHITKEISYYEEKYKERKEKGMITRFAPSPTGFVHMGSLYVSFIDFIFAHQNNGVFYLRIEDTDQERLVENGVSAILRDLKNFDIIPDEGMGLGGEYGPYLQSERKEIYETYAKHLVSLGLAYPCFCTKEELEEIRSMQEENKERIGYYGDFARYRNASLEEIKKHLEKGESFVIRLKSMGDFEKKITFHDEIKGDIVFPENDLDVVLLKSNHLPTYHFAHVIDDHLMHTTCVIRGDEWISSVPLHLQLFSYFSFPLPKYAHISPLTKKEGDTIRKLSKRKDKECSVSFYEEMGIPSDVLKLYFAQMMNYDFEEWYLTHENESILSFPFQFSHMAEGGSLFDLEKLFSISKIYFARKKASDIYEEILPYYEKHQPDFYQLLKQDRDYAISFLNIERGGERARKDIASYQDVLKEFWYLYDEFFFEKSAKELYQEVVVKDTWDISLLEQYIKNIYNPLDSEEEWLDKIKQFGISFGYCDSIKEYKKEKEKYLGHFGDICSFLRVVVTTKTMTPNLYDILKLLGKERILKRISYFKSRN